MTYVKDFIGWHSFKTSLNAGSGATFKEREIWWCSVGINVGDEEDGKNHQYSRPVLILKKFNHKVFWGLPLTTKIKENPYYFRINFKGNDQSVMLTQLKVFDSRRLSDKMGYLTYDQFVRVRDAVSGLLKITQPPRGG